MSNQANRIVMLLLRVGAHLNRTGNRITDQFGLNQQQFVVLNEVVNHGPITQKHLVDDLIYEKSNTSKIVKKLLGLNLIEIEPWPDDGRAHGLKATEKGKKTWQSCMEIMNHWNDEWLKSFTKKDKVSAIKILDKLYRISQGVQK